MSFVTKASEPLPRYRGAWLLMGWVLLLLVAAGSLAPSPPESPIGASDKLMHFAAYAALAFAFAGVYPRRYWRGIALALLLFGASIELLQGTLIATRSGEWLDLLANATGIAAGLALAALFPLSWCRHLELAAGLGGAGR
jgi:VanZ family protein